MSEKQEEKYYCLNCNEEIVFRSDVTTCENCMWKNGLDEAPDEKPIVLKTKEIENLIQYCYPLIEESDLQELPEQLRIAINIYFKTPERFTSSLRENIYNNLYKKKAIKFEKIARKYNNKAKLALFFQSTNLYKKVIR